MSKSLFTSLHNQKIQNSFGVVVNNDNQPFRQNPLPKNQRADRVRGFLFSRMANRTGKTFSEKPTFSTESENS